MNVTCAGTWRCNGGIWWWDVVGIRQNGAPKACWLSKLVQDPSRLPKKCEEDVKPRDSRCSGSSLSGHHLDLAWLSCCDKETPVDSQTKQN